MEQKDALVFAAIFVLASVVPVMAGEDCSKLGGKCHNVCGMNETSEAGAFEDCSDKDQCCVPKSSAGDAARCCVLSFQAGSFGPDNCKQPRSAVCEKGSASPIVCEKLALCKK